MINAIWYSIMLGYSLIFWALVVAGVQALVG